MKKSLKAVGSIVAALILVTVVLVGIQSFNRKKYAAPSPGEYQTSAQIQRGLKALTSTVSISSPPKNATRVWW